MLLFAGLLVALCSNPRKALASNPDWKSVHLDFGKRWIDLTFEPRPGYTRMVVCIALLRDQTGAPVEGYNIRYADISVRVFDRSGREVRCKCAEGEGKYFTPIGVGIGSLNGEYSLPSGVRGHLRRAIVVFEGRTIEIPLDHLVSPWH